MSDEQPTSILEALKREKARLLEQAAAVDRDMEELTRLATKYNFVVTVDNTKTGEIRPAHPEATKSTAPETLSDLIKVYKTHEKSGFQNLTHASRNHYTNLLNLIDANHGARPLLWLQPEDFEVWHQTWSEGGKKLGIAHAKISMVRGLVGFGTEILRDDNCGRLFGILCKLKFQLPKSRTERLTVAQANSIRAKARSMGRPSISLAQAFQTGVGMLQKDVIGEWVPVGEKPVSEITDGALKWIRGLRWNEIGPDLVLRHASTWHGDIEFDLRKSPMVLDELRMQFEFNVEKGFRSLLNPGGQEMKVMVNMR